MSDINDGFGMTPEGFRIKRREDIENDIYNDLEAKWGEIKRNPESTIGQLVGVMATPYVRAWLELEKLWLSLDPDSSDGVRLDNLCKYTSIKRKDATGTVVLCTAFGTDGVVIAEGSLVSDSDGNLYGAVDDFTISSSVLSFAEVKLDDYNDVITRKITITAGEQTITYANSSSGDVFKADFSSWLNSQVSAGLIPSGITAEITADGFDLLSLSFVSFSVSGLVKITLDKVGSPLIVRNTVTGAIPAPRSSVKNIVTTISGFDSVLNYANGFIGNDIEDDVSLRIRRRRSKFRGGANIDAIASNIENAIDGIKSVRVYENDKDTVVDGLKPHSIYVVVEGAEGEDDKIADMIWVSKGNGIDTNGSISVTILDNTGESRAIYFDRPITTYAFVRVDITAIEGDKVLPVDWQKQIVENITAIIGNMTIGDDLIANRIATGVYSVNGVLNATVEVATGTNPTTPSTNWTTGSIEASKYEKIILASSVNITVTESV